MWDKGGCQRVTYGLVADTGRIYLVNTIYGRGNAPPVQGVLVTVAAVCATVRCTEETDIIGSGTKRAM